MLSEGWQIITEAYNRYSADGILQVIIIASVVILLINEKKEYVKHIAYYTIALVILICMPPISYILNKYFIQDVYFRTFWLVPGALLTAYVIIKAYEKAGRRRGNAIVVTFIVVLMLGGKFVYTNENFVKAENMYKIPDEAIEICEIVTAEGDDVKIVVPEDIVSYIRQYDAGIELMYGRNLGKDVQRGGKFKFLNQLNYEINNIKWMAKYAKRYEVDYLVFPKRVNGSEEIENYSYKLIDETETYCIYKYCE